MRIGHYTALETHIWNMLEPSVNHEGFRLVQVRFIESKQRTLQIMIDHNEGEGVVSVDECANISNYVSALLDVEDPIQGHYNLEVSSPGMDRPLTSQADLVKHVGYVVKLVCDPIDGRKNFTGTVESVNDEAVTLRDERASYAIDIPAIHHAKLVLNNRLIDEAMKRHKQTEIND